MYWAFEQITQLQRNRELYEEFKRKFITEVGSLKSFLFTKKEELDTAVRTYDESRIYLQKSRKSNPNIISSTKVKSENESFKLVSTDAKKLQKRVRYHA